MATMGNSVSGVFVRTGKFKTAGKGKYAGRKRETIKQLYGPGVVQMLENEETKTLIQEKFTERFNKELDHQIQYLLDKAQGRFYDNADVNARRHM